MSEFLEKLEQQELVVTPAVTVVAANGLASSNSIHTSSESPPIGSGSIPTSSESTHARSESIPTSSESIHSRSEPIPTSSESMHSSLKSADRKSGAPGKTPKGIVRHRMITGCCVTLSLAILSLSAFDLRGLIDKQGILDSNLKFTPMEKKVSQLPLHMRSDNSVVSEGLRKVTTYSDDTIGFADEDGNLVLPAIYSEAGDFHDGVAAVKFRGEKDPKSGTYQKKENQKWSYINKLGETVLPPTYEDAGQFNNGVAPVMIDGHGALIDKQGDTIATSKSAASPIQIGDYYEVSTKEFRNEVIDNKGQVVVPPIYDRIDKLEQTQTYMRRHGRNRKIKKADPTELHYFKVYQNGKCGLVAVGGEVVVPIKYQNIASFNDGHAVVLQNDSWGLIDKNGLFIIKPKYKFLSMYDDLIAARDRNNEWTIFNSSGKAFNTKIDGAFADQSSPWVWNGMAAIVVGDKCGFVNTEGELVIKPEYDLVQHFSKGMGLVLSNGTWKYVDRAGKDISSMTFSDASPFEDGKADVTLTGAIYPFINASQIDSKKYETERSRSDAKSGEGSS